MKTTARNILLVATSLIFLFIFQTTPVFGQNLTVLGGFYDQVEYPGYPVKGTYKIEFTKDNYTFTADQFSIGIFLPQTGSYDPARASEAIIPEGWELVVVEPNVSLMLRLLPGMVYTGTGAAVNRRKDFYIPIITSGPAVEVSSLVTVQWNDFEVTENPTGNSGGSNLNVRDEPMPVKLASFTTSLEGTVTKLNWTTTEELNSDRFEIEHRLRGESWNKLGAIAGKGDSKLENLYTYVHDRPTSGINYYRLKMIDKDNTFEYSPIRSIKVEGGPADLVKVFPNPVKHGESLTIETNGGQIRQIELVTSAGIKVYESATPLEGVNKIRTDTYAAGLYVVRVLYADGSSSVRKVILGGR